MSRWTTKRTSGRSMPMPKAMVATITTGSPERNRISDVALQLRIQAGMERQRREAFFAQLRRHPLGLGAAAAIDDAAGARDARLRKSRSCAVSPTFGAADDAQIGAVEAGDEHLRPLHPQRRQDVLLRARVRRGGQRDARHAGEQVRQPRQFPEFGAEFMTPLGNAVRLIDREQRQPHTRSGAPACRSPAAARARHTAGRAGPRTGRG